MMAVVDLSPAGAQVGTINGAIITDFFLGGAGSGNINAFISIGGNADTKQGYNSSFRPVQFDETNSASFNHDLPLSEVPLTVINGVAYREFLLDTNEVSGDSRFVSLNRLEIYQSAAGGLTAYPFTDGTGPTATLVYDMDAGTAGVDTAAPSPNGNWVRIDNNEGIGGGNANAVVYIPNALFAQGGFVTLFSRFGDTVATDDGPEEWAVRVQDEVFTISGRKFNDLDGDGTDDGGTDPGLANWTIFIDANDNGSLDAGEPSAVTGADGAYSLPSLVPGTFIVCEVPQVGWTQSFPQTADGCHSVIVTAENVEGIDFGNFQAGSITVVKDATPNDLADFSFTSPQLGNFQLDDDAGVIGGDNTLLGTQVFSNLTPGTYVITEAQLAGWDLTSLTINDPDGGSSVDLATRTVTIDLDSGEALTVTFANTRQATVTIVKSAIGGDDTFDFDGTGLLPADLDITTVGGTGTSQVFTFSNLPAAGSAASITELLANLPAGWDFKSVQVIGDDDAITTNQTATLNVEPGENIVVTFNNTKQATIQIVKSAIGGDDTFDFDGTGLLPADLDITTVGGTGTSQVFTLSNLPASGFAASITELLANLPAGWNFTSVQVAGDDDAVTANQTATLNVEPGENIIVTFTNTRQATVQVVKNAIGSNDTFDFDGTGLLPADLDITTVGGTGSSQVFTLSNLPAGGSAASITELLANLPAGWSFTSVGVAGDDDFATVGQTATLNVEPGENIVVTFTNTRDATVQLFKNTIGGDLTSFFEGADVLPVGFAITTVGGIGASQVFTLSNLPAGGLAASIAERLENLPSGWSFTSLDVTGDDDFLTAAQTATLNVEPGENIVLTFTNTRDATVQIVKNTIGGDDTFDFDGTGLLPADLDITTVGGTGTSQVFTFNNLPGSGAAASITELLANLPAGWNFTSVQVAGDDDAVTANQTATLNVEPGETIVVTFTNTVQRVGVDIEKLVNGLDADLPTGPLLPLGSTATFSYLVTNTGEAPLSNVVVVDDNGTPANLADDFNPTFTSGDANTNGLLDVGEVWTYIAARIVTAGQYTNIGSVNGTGPTGQVTDSDAANHFGVAAAIDIEKFVGGLDADLPTGPLLPVGSTATFTYVVTNPGNVPLGNVAVLDDNGTPGNLADDFTPTFVGGDINTNGLLDIGEIWVYTATRIVTAGQYTNIGSATGTSPIQTTVSDSDAANHFGVAAAIDIEKFVGGLDADLPTGPLLPVGSTATFTYIVTNTGNVPLSGVVVVDDNGTPANLADDFNPTFTGGDANTNGLLDVGEIWTYTAARIVTAGQYTNIGSVVATTLLQDTVTDSDAANHFGVAAAIDIEKLVNGDDADLPTGPLLVPGSTATFTYVVTNTGNVALSGVVVLDDNGTPANLADDFIPTFTGGDTNGNSLLDLAETWTYTAARIVTAGQYTNIGSVTATSPAGGQVTDSDAANHFGAVTGVDIEKLVNGQDADNPSGPTLPVGSTAVFTFLVTNTGNVPLSNVVVTDDNATPGDTSDDFHPAFVGGDVNTNGLLDPGEVWEYTASRVVVAGSHVNVATVEATSPIEEIQSDSDPANFVGGQGTIIITPDKTNGSLPFVHVVDADTGEVLVRFLAYEESYRGGVRVATGDVNGDGIAEIITAPGRGRAPLVRIWDQDGNLLRQFLAFGKKFRGGVDVSVGDVTGDGLADIAAAMSFKGSQVKVFKNTSSGNIPFSPLSFQAFSTITPFGSKFKGGATVELADMGTPVIQGGKKQLDATSLDGRAEVIVGNESGMRSTVKVFTFFGANTKAQVRTFQPFDASFRGGVSVDVAPIDADLVPDIIVGTGNGGGSQVAVLSGLDGSVISSFTAFTAAEATPSHNAPIDVTAFGKTILVAQGTDGQVGQVRAFDALTGTLLEALPESAFDSLFAGNPIDDFANAYFLATLDSNESDEQTELALIDDFFASLA